MNYTTSEMWGESFLKSIHGRAAMDAGFCLVSNIRDEQPLQSKGVLPLESRRPGFRDTGF